MIEKCERARHLIKIMTLVVFYIINVTGRAIKVDGFIYILEWTPPTVEPFNFLEKGRKAFVKRNCTYQNCYLTSNHSYFRNVMHFDALIFNAWHLNMDLDLDLPSKRSKMQKYIMVAMEPSGYYPVPDEFNGFFNLTWTYKLDSNVTFPYIVIKNQYDEVVGPKEDMQWISLEEMNETSDYIKNKLQNKYIAAAWIASNCYSHQRLAYVRDLQKELSKYGHHVDVYGQCGNFKCPRLDMMDECYALIESDYYFYLAFENSFGVDYVSEKLLHALEHYAVPIVLGGANYSRFMPEGTYLNALSSGPAELAKTMSEIINDTNRYYEFFKWHGYYSFHFTGEDAFYREVCGLCELLNNQTVMHQQSAYNNIVDWWNGGSRTGHVMPAPEWELILDDEKTVEESIGVKLVNFVFDK